MRARPSLLCLLLALAPLACQGPAQAPTRPPVAEAAAVPRQAAPALLKAESLGVVQAFPDDPDIDTIIAPKRMEIRATFDQPLCQCPQGLFRGRNGDENLMGYWVTDVMRSRASKVLGRPVKFALTNSGGLRGNLASGVVRVADIYGVMPFENELVTIEMTGQEVMDALKQGILHRGDEPSSGVKVVVSGTVADPVYTITWDDGKAIDPNEVITAATTDYLFAGGDSIPALKKGRHPFTTGLAIRQILLDACGDLAKANQPLLPPSLGRHIIPHDLYQAARDHKLGK